MFLWVCQQKLNLRNFGLTLKYFKPQLKKTYDYKYTGLIKITNIKNEP